MINPVEHERNQLLNIIASIRQALGTPENASITHHAAQVVAEAQRARDDLAQARTMLQQAHEELQVAQARANQCKSQREAELSLGNSVLADHIHAMRAALGVSNFCTAQVAEAQAAQVSADAAKWRAVPWETMDTLIYYGQHGFNFDDELSDLQQWWLMNAPQEARG